jgi:hypothetical protein
MDRLSGVKKDITEMSLEELREYVRQIRKDRRISKSPPKEKKERVQNIEAGKKKAEKNIGKLTPEQQLQLLLELEGED